MADENLFDNLQSDDPAQEQRNINSFLDQYVGEGKKYKSPEDLAKAYANADQHIPRLESELKSMREMVSGQFEQLYERISKNPQQSNEDQTDRDDRQEPARQTPPNGNDEAGEDDLNTRIKRVLEETNQESVAQRNAAESQRMLEEHFGSTEEAQKAVLKRANELGVAPQFLADAAFRSPNALMKLMDLDKRSTSTPSSRSDVNVRAFEGNRTGPRPGTYEYYRNLQRTNPREYMRPEVQNRMMKEALEKGEDFFKT